MDINGTLKIQVTTDDGKTEKLTVAELTEKYGYTVQFLASKEVFKVEESDDASKSSDGVLDTTINTKSFQYEIVVKDAEGNVVENAGVRGTVTLEEQSKIVVSVEPATWTVGEDKLNSSTLANGKAAQFTVLGKTKVDGKPVDLVKEGLVTFEVSPLALADVEKDANGKATGEVTAKEGVNGEVTVTIKVAGQPDQKVTLKVAKEVRKVSAENSTITTVSPIVLAADTTTE